MAKIKAINQKAAKVMDKLTENLTKPGDHKIFDAHGYTEKWDGGIMAVHVEHVGFLSYFNLFSITHYFKQNGDMCQDPEMLFFKRDNKYFPSMFQTAIPPVYEESVFLKDDDVVFNPRLQADHKAFANTWMLNIKEQQGL